MKVSWEPLDLDLKTTFRIAHGTSERRENVLVRLAEGIGEAPAVYYYGETRALIEEYLNRLPDLGDNMEDLDAVLARRPPGSLAARAAIDIALHDLWGKRLGQPLYRLFGLNPDSAPETSFTIALDDPEIMAERAKESGMPIIKAKLGGDRDEEIVAAIKNAADVRLRVDANAGWSRERALQLIPILADLGVELVEQPLAADDIEGLRLLKATLAKRGVRVPIFADESVRTAADVVTLVGAVDGIVVKIMKAGGIRESIRAIHTARACGMLVMVSCMVESCVAVSAAAHIAPLCDYADLDGPLLVKNDRHEGLLYEKARVRPSGLPGLGVVPKSHNAQG